jgi:hypothetical protein
MVEPLEAGATQVRTTRELPEVILATGLPGALAAWAGRLSVVSRVVRTAMTTTRIRLVFNTISPTFDSKQSHKLPEQPRTVLNNSTQYLPGEYPPLGVNRPTADIHRTRQVWLSDQPTASDPSDAF